MPGSPCAAFNIETANIRSTTSTEEIGRIRIMWWRQAIEQGRAGKPPDHPVAQALAQAQAQHSLSFRFLEQLLDAREADLGTKQPVDMSQLLGYCERTAGALQARPVSRYRTPAGALPCAAQTLPFALRATAARSRVCGRRGYGAGGAGGHARWLRPRSGDTASRHGVPRLERLHVCPGRRCREAFCQPVAGAPLACPPPKARPPAECPTALAR